jgi:hypothetical protein
VTVPTGAWYVGIEPSAELRKAYDDGELTGVSLEGTGVREPVTVAKSDDKQTLWKKLGAALGLHEDSGTLTNDPLEEKTVADKDYEKLEAEVSDIAKAQGALVTAVEGLVGTVNNLVERLDAKKKDEGEEKQATPADVKKSLDEFADSVIGKLDELDGQIGKLADQGSSQGDEPDAIKKSKSDNSHALSGIL